MKILFLSRWFPYPADNGARLRVLNLIQQLSARHEVDLVSFHDAVVAESQMAALRQWCADVQVVPFHDFQPRRAKAILAYASPLPRFISDTHSTEMEQAVARAAERGRPDLVVASTVTMASYALALPDVGRVLEEVELGLMRHDVDHAPDTMRRLRSQLTWLKFARYVSGLIRQFDAFTTVSDRELRAISELGVDVSHGHVVPNGVDMSKYGGDFGQPRPRSLVYAGALTFSANLDAVSYFLSDIYPQVQVACPGITFSVTGKYDGISLSDLRLDDSVTLTGYLDDVRPHIAQSWVSVVPLRAGGGTRLKILESLALGTPVVATSKGAEGLDLTHGQHLLVADSPRDFAQATASLIGDADLRARLAEDGRRAVAQKYDWAHIGRGFRDIVESCGGRVAAPASA